MRGQFPDFQDSEGGIMDNDGMKQEFPSGTVREGFLFKSFVPEYLAQLYQSMLIVYCSTERSE